MTIIMHILAFVTICAWIFILIPSKKKEAKLQISIDKIKYIYKLERRIHNQRIALHDNWRIVEMRLDGISHYHKPIWFKKAMELMIINQDLRNRLKEAESDISSKF